MSAVTDTAIARYAARYVERLGFGLVPLRGKMPYRESWNADAQLIRTPEAAHEHWSAHPHDNIGCCLEPSALVSLDADDPESARLVLAAEGVDLDSLIAATPTIMGRAPRLEFRAPDMPLSRKSVVWPPRTAGAKPTTVLEFRAGRVQDVLPPSVHPDLQRPYQWLTPPKNGLPPLPDSILALWKDFSAFRHRARNLCPWAEPEQEPAPVAPRAPYDGPSVIRAFNQAHDSVAILEAHGYQRAGKKRWRSPDGHGASGVVLLPDGKIYCHHASDALGDGKAHDAFDLYVQLEHRGDQRAAIKTAAHMLGLSR